jgi:DNA-binding beta-propeller fold protein YncE
MLHHRRALPRATRLLLAATAAGGVLLSTMSAAGAGTYNLDRRLTDSRIIESSGLARSTYDREVLFTHNDSGDSARVFAIDPSGKTQAVLSLGGVKSRDDEDIAAGPNHTLWLADIGDNWLRRDDYRVYKFTEPANLSTQTVRATTYRLAYPDGRHNAEGVMVNPVTGRLYVVTKSVSGAGIYQAPANLSASSVNRLTRVASAPSLIKAASFSPDGSRFVLSGRYWVYVYRSIGGTPITVPKPPLRQGESVTISRGGGSMFVGSEGSDSPVYRMPMP